MKKQEMTERKPTGKKVAVIGSRNIQAAKGVGAVIDGFEPIEIVGGGCQGATQIGKAYAKYKKLPYTEFKPEYAKYGRVATHIRNEAIAAYCDVMVAIWDGKSKGTKSEIDKAKKKGKEVVIFLVENDG